MTDAIAAAFLLVGAAFVLVAAVGLARLPDLYTRMHAVTKAGTVGVGSVMLAVALAFGTPSTTARAAAVVIFVALTAPVAAHMIGRAAYLAGVELWEGTFVDELSAHPGAAPGKADTGRSDRGREMDSGG